MIEDFLTDIVNPEEFMRLAGSAVAESGCFPEVTTFGSMIDAIVDMNPPPPLLVSDIAIDSRSMLEQVTELSKTLNQGYSTLTKEINVLSGDLEKLTAEIDAKKIDIDTASEQFQALQKKIAAAAAEIKITLGAKADIPLTEGVTETVPEPPIQPPQIKI